MTTRRTFLRTSSLAAVAALGTPRLARAAALPHGGVPDNFWSDDPDLKALAKRALDAATAGGARYADVRITRTQQRRFTGTQTVEDSKVLAVGVRALVNGAWGFAAHTAMTPDMVAWLGRTAAELGDANAWPNRPPIELGERPPAAVGSWRMPIARDPFEVPIPELLNSFQAIIDKAQTLEARVSLQVNFERQERTFASTDGAFTTQTVYNTLGRQWPAIDSGLIVAVRGGRYRVPFISPSGTGFEMFEAGKLLERIPEWVAKAEEMRDAKPLESPGRYEMVFDAYAMAALVSSLGAALEVDRALGYEANAGGTSFLAPLDEILGTPQLPQAVTITADRTMPGGVATVQWDDEGVTPQAFPLVKDGVVVDYATSREFVPELAGWYRKRGQPLRSHGCAASENALAPPLVQTPNLILQPGAKDLSFEELLVGIEDGFAVMGGDVDMDQQQLNGMSQDAVIYAVKKGKLAGRVREAGYLFRMPELWKSLVALGGAQTAATRGFTVEKGQPTQDAVHSVRAVAARFKNVTIRSLGSGRSGATGG